MLFRKKYLDDSYNYFSDRVYIIKGVLVLCVVIEHNLEVETLFPRIKIVFESFDVFGFFLLAFCFPGKQFSMEFFKTRAFRYLIPFFWFYSVSSLLYNFLIIDISIIDFIKNYLLGLLILSTDLIKNASGFSLFWFLPCFLALITLRSIYVLNINFKLIFILLGVGFHFFFSSMLTPYAKWIPLSISVALFCFPVCLFFEKIWPYAKERFILGLICFSLFIVSLSLIGFYKNKMYLFASHFPNLSDPVWLLIHDVCVLSSIPGLYWLVSIYNSKTLILIGKYSLGIYLTHNLVYYAIKFTFPISRNSLISVLLTIFFTILGATLATLGINKIIWMKKLIYPMHYQDWRIWRK